MTITILIPMEIPSQNVRDLWHWSKRAREVKSWTYQFRAKCRPLPNVKRMVHITSYRKQRITDIANLIGGAKGLCDGLSHAGLIMDDADSCVQFTYSQGTLADLRRMEINWTKPCTVITLTELSEIGGRGALADGS